MASASTTLPKSIGILLFPGFEALDAFGPLEVINALSTTHPLTLSLIAASLGPVSTLWPGAHSVGQQVVPTVAFGDVKKLDILIVPGGYGAFYAGSEVVEFLKRVAGEVGSLITVCNGSALVATAGILDGKRATSNKAYWKQCTALGPKTHWIAKARWVRDGNIWTSSGVCAGIDAALAWVESEFGAAKALEIADMMEFERAVSEGDDPFSEKYGCVDVPAVESS